MTIAQQIAEAKAKLKTKNRACQGLRVIFLEGEFEVFPKGSHQTKFVISNLDAQNPENWEIGTNLLDEVLVRQIKWNPNFYLI